MRDFIRKYLIKMLVISNIMLIFCIFYFLNTDKTFAFAEINKSLSLKTGYLYVLRFDDKVVKYSIGNTKAADIEIINNIFDDRHELLIKPVSSVSTNLLVWTGYGVFNFNIDINQQNSEKKDNTDIFHSPQIQTYDKQSLSDDLKSEMGSFEIDKPPSLPDSHQETFSFEIDKPPGM